MEIRSCIKPPARQNNRRAALVIEFNPRIAALRGGDSGGRRFTRGEFRTQEDIRISARLVDFHRQHVQAADKGCGGHGDWSAQRGGRSFRGRYIVAA